MTSSQWQSRINEVMAGELARLNGISDAESGGGTVSLIWQPPPMWGNVGGKTIFGGAISSALEFAMAYACGTVLQDDEAPVLVRLQVDCIRPVSVGDINRLTGRIDDRSGRMIWCSAEIVNKSDKSTARGSGLLQIVTLGRFTPPS